MDASHQQRTAEAPNATANSKNINPYHGGRTRSDMWELANVELRSPEEAPHMAAVKAAVDRFQPEFHMA